MEATVEDNQEDGEEEEDDDDHHSTSVRKTLSSTLVWSFALILFIYVGGEAAFAAWLVTFLLRIKIWIIKLHLIWLLHFGLGSLLEELV